MKRLVDYFQSAKTCSSKTRRIGMEVETLFQDGHRSEVITRCQSQQIMMGLVAMDWVIMERKGEVITRVGKVLPGVGEFVVFYELGWNNIEVVTPTYPIGNWFGLFKDVQQVILPELYGASSVVPIEDCYDLAEDEDTLMLPDKRDQIWTRLDGDVLKVLGHIASVHINIDLCSIEEGFEFIRSANRVYNKMNWPPRAVVDVWSRYLRESLAGYEGSRYGPSPTDFDEYVEVLAGYRVFMNIEHGQLVMLDDPKPFWDTIDVDLDMFLRSVWWWNRLRVRNGQLVLEIRGIPRGNDMELLTNCLEFFA